MSQFSHIIPAQRASLVEERAQFIVRTYAHLLGAIVAFTLFEVALFKSGLAYVILQVIGGTSWLLVLGGFMVASWVASHFAHRVENMAGQYFGLALYIAAQGILFVPLLAIANSYADGIIASAAGVTLLGFAGLTAVAFITRKDFSFLRSFLLWGGIVAMLLVVAAVLFGIHLGTFFSVAMVGFAGAAILYDTSNVLHHFPSNRYVGAALQLFSSVALMFWYVLRIFIASRD
ncbi:MAG: US12 family protein [Polyangiaceae bacterium]|nr:US12 family protein [Polyangiaceae bacterium]MCW5789885.1 US12 family protein [Polyangiaceae bacterium]